MSGLKQQWCKNTACLDIYPWLWQLLEILLVVFKVEKEAWVLQRRMYWCPYSCWPFNVGASLSPSQWLNLKYFHITYSRSHKYSNTLRARDLEIILMPQEVKVNVCKMLLVCSIIYTSKRRGSTIMSIDMGFVVLSIIHPKNWLLDSFFFKMS